jgi:hypothetical protein
MTDEEKFRFDLQGFLVVEDVLSASECLELSRLADEAWPEQPGDGPLRRTSFVSRWHPRYLDLIDHPTILPLLIELLGSRLRIDHDYSIFMKTGAGANALHGGPRIRETDHWYHYQDGIMRNGLTVATWALSDAGPGDGGFACIPGSHKTNFLKNLPRDVHNFEREPDYVVQPELRAGSVLIFTEALIHGTRAWRADHERRTVLYKYSPPHSTWAVAPYDPAKYPDATDQQRRLMAPPSVEAHARVVEDDG